VKYLLDTDHISILQKQSGQEFTNVAARIAQHPHSDVAFSIVSFHEQVLGCHAYLNRARNSADPVRGYDMVGQVQRDFAAAIVLPFDGAAASEFDSLLAQRIRIATMDLRLAAITLSRGLTLLTRNKRDFSKVPGLMFSDWTT
jgi:tRNA(fMet)-specific endonuclease VapC